MLHGRSLECATIDRLLAGARAGRSGAVVVRGEAGVGKTALLEYAHGRADGMRVLRAVAVEAEAELAFAALHHLLHSELHRLDHLPAPQAAALGGALGLATAPRADRFLISVATLTLLAEAAEETPVLCLVDDAQWLDEPSADALTFATRRLQAEGVVALFAAREPDVRAFAGPGLPDLWLSGIDARAAGALLAERAGRELAPAVAERLIRQSGGNPLALVELVEMAPGADLDAAGDVSVSRAVQDAFLARARRLPESTQRLLLLAAADDRGESTLLVRAATQLGLDAADLAPAEAAGLVRVEPQSVRFRHPLMRAAVYQSAPFAQRREVHEALAATLDGPHDADRRVWHRAAGQLGFDATTAAELERSGERALALGGPASGAAALQRAAELSPTDDDRARRLVGAADALWLAGRPERALALAERAAPLTGDPLLLADIARLRGSFETVAGNPAHGCDILLAAAEAVGGRDLHRAMRLLAIGLRATTEAGDEPRQVRLGRLAARLAPANGEDRLTADVLVGIMHRHEGDEPAALRLLRSAVQSEGEAASIESMFSVLVATIYLGEEWTVREILDRSLARARRLGALSALPGLLVASAYWDITAGRLTLASAAIDEALRLARESGQINLEMRNQATLAVVEAIQGRNEAATAHASEALSAALARGLGLTATFATWALVLVDLGLGRPDDAATRLEPLLTESPEPRHSLVAVWTFADLVEAAVRSGRLETARDAGARLQHYADRTERPWLLALAARCRALTGSAAEAEENFVAALRLHSGSIRSFDLARTQLLFGEFLRRQRRRAEAREHLRAAAETFERFGARPWTERAVGELRATGEHLNRRKPDAVEALTAQELQVARHVAQGASNREVAAQLFLSHRTVGYHLQKVYRKLGISTRNELIRIAL